MMIVDRIYVLSSIFYFRQALALVPFPAEAAGQAQHLNCHSGSKKCVLNILGEEVIMCNLNPHMIETAVVKTRFDQIFGLGQAISVIVSDNS